jgi:hypothetical protein
MINSHELESVEEPVLRQFRPKPLRWDEVDPETMVISYDRRSDTLLVHLFGRRRPSVSVPIRRYLYAMVDPDSEEIIGIHIEGFLSQAVREHPQEITLLDYAERRGITLAEVRELQRGALGIWRPLIVQLRAALASASAIDKMKAVSLLLDAEDVRWSLSGIPAA